MRSFFVWFIMVVSIATGRAAVGDFPKFEAREIDPHAGEVVYAVTVADVNADRKPDVVAVTEDAVVWYENPAWTKHDIVRKQTARDNVCIQPYDIDGDGRIDFALGAGWRPPDTKNASTLQWLGRDAAGAWQVHAIGFSDPTLHRLRWGKVKEQDARKKQLVVVPLQGRGTKGPNWGAGQGSRVLVYDIPEKLDTTEWPVEVADDSLHTIHNLQLLDLNADGRDEIVLAAWEGVFILERGPGGKWSKTRVGTGDQQSTGFKGASEVKVGKVGKALPYIATIEPWHGHQVVVYTTPDKAAAGDGSAGLWNRQVIAEPVQWGHAVWCADLDDDGDEELIIGQRDANKSASALPRGPGLFVFDPKVGANPGSLTFERHTIDDGGMACEDAMAADLDGDGRLDLIAGGRATHNVKIYWNRK
jgi:hypothetical protein